MYDKTVFKPEEVTTLSGRYKLSVPSSGQSDASISEAGSSSSGDSPKSNETSEAPSQFDLGDFSDMKPAEDAAPAGQTDELPLLGGPDINQ